MFYIYSDLSNYYYCSEIINYDLKLFGFNISLIFQESCDFSIYLKGFEDFSSIFESNYIYQGRPLYIGLINVITSIFVTIFPKLTILNFYFGMILSQTLILSLCSLIVLNLFEEKISPNTENYTILLISLSPIVKFGLFDPSHQLLTVLSFILSFYYLKNKENITYNNSYKHVLVCGLLFLSNKVFLVAFFILLIATNIKKLRKEKNINPYHFLISCFLFLIPYAAYSLFINFSGYISYEAETELYGHFIWVLYFSNGHIIHTGQWFCHSIPENFWCYFQDYINAIRYLLSPIVYFALLIYFLKKTIDNYKTYSALLITFLIYFIFWSFMGWYPPLRLSLYSLGIALSLALILIIQYIPKKNLNLHVLGIVFYYLGLNHWNYPEVILQNLLTTVGTIFFVINLISIYMTKSNSFK